MYYGMKSEITGYQVIRRPAHGVLGSAGHNGVRFLTAYDPAPGYVGADEFEVGISYSVRKTGIARSTVVHVDMTIAP